ncbi:hypothetical protein [Archangium lipolyticum]|uniref:hypothetical protein n=1 Tax=Archangium lipolyticum TaxID=2970465 RepID=UPI00214A7E33|nr:hypothetical protein [Archangium lipolyticum]
MASNQKRKLWYFLLLAFSVYGGNSWGGQNASGPARKANPEYQMNWQTFSLRGKVKFVRETEDKPPAPGIGPENLEQLWFDPAGNVTRRVTTRADEYYGDKRYKYDGVGNYEEVEHYKQDNTLKFTAKNTFDADGNLVEYAEFTQGTRLTYKRINTYEKYTPEEHIMEVKWVVPPSRPGDTVKYVTRFDAQGRKTQVEVYRDSRKAVFSKTLYQYNPDNTVEETHYEYSRDNPDQVDSKRVTLYDAAHRVLSRKFTRSASSEDNFDESTRYDPAGNIVEYTWTNPQGVDLKRSYRNDYVYDKQGNWTRRVTSSPKRAFRGSVTRRIEYYPAAADR